MAALRSSTTALLRRTSGNPASQASASQSSRCLSTLTHRSSSAAPRRIGPSPLVQQHVLNNSSVNTTRTLFTRRAPPSPIRNFLSGTLLIIGGVFFVAYYIDSRSAIHRWVAIPILKATLDPEAAQKLAIRMCASGLAPRDIVDDDQVLEAEVFGKRLSNPIGLAAGFDKQGEAIDGLLDLGFGIVEIGSVTPVAQPGNPQPRYFRLNADHAAINRFGFNSDGHSVVLGRLRDRIRKWLLHESNVADMSLISGGATSRQTAEKLLASHPDSAPGLVDAAGLPRSLREGKLLSINLGKNKSSAEEDVSDYIKGVHKLGPYADLIVVNVSSPNTPGLRRLQRRGVLNDLLKQVVVARDEMVQETFGTQGASLPLLVKIAPDLDESQLHDVADAASESGVDGIILSNTTIQRPESLVSTAHIGEQGGLSGPPLKPLSIKALQIVRKRVGKEMTLIGCGGVHTAQDAIDFAKAGASAVQLYTSFGYEGVGHPRRLKDELTTLLKQQGTTWKQIVGSGIELKDVNETVPKSQVELDDYYRKNVASIKAELEGLRTSLSGEKTEAVQGAKEGTETAVAAGTAITASPFFSPDPEDKDYTQLLERVHEVLGRRGKEEKRQTTKGEQINWALETALQDPEVPAYAVGQSMNPSGAVAPGTSPIRGDVPEKEDDKKKSNETSKNGGWFSNLPSLSTSAKESKSETDSKLDATRTTNLVGMDGPRPDFKAADRLRVV